MVKNICLYAIEIWGIEERKVIESIQERYLKNILGLEMHIRLPGKRADENRKDYDRGRRESN